MAREKKAVVKSIKERKINLSLKGKASSIAIAMLALVLSILVFGLLLFAQNKLTDEIIYQQVVVAKVDVPENEIITEANAQTYFELKNMNVLDTTSGFMTGVDSIIGKQSKVSLLKGEIISDKDFKNNPSYLEGLKNPVEISIDVGSIANADGGKIRGGDVVNLTMMYSREQLSMDKALNTVSQTNGNSLFYVPTLDIGTDEEEIIVNDDDDLLFDDEIADEAVTEETEAEPEVVETPAVETVSIPATTSTTTSSNGYVFDYYAKYVLENLYVVKALDSAGTEISPTDTTSSANILVFVIEKEDEQALNNALTNCSNIRISKIVDTDSADTIYSNVQATDNTVPETEAEPTLAEQIAEEATQEDETSEVTNEEE